MTGEEARGHWSSMSLSHGEAALLEGDFEKAAWSLDSALYLSPELGSTLWQRGLACFYSGRYREAMQQFQADMAENGSDVEDVIWHFLCRCRLYGFEKAQTKGSFLRLSGNPTIVPMMEVLQLHQGTGTPSDILAASTREDGSPAESYNGTSALAYAHFYIGLYHETKGEIEEAKMHLQTAAEMDNPDYVGKLMQMHYKFFVKTAYPSARIPIFSVGQKQCPKEAYNCSVIIQGGWQLSRGHVIHAGKEGDENRRAEVISDLLAALDSGVTAFDCGDIYTGVEELYGALIRAHCQRGGLEEDISIHTKLVPDLDAITAGKVDGDYIRAVVRRSLNRLGVKTLSLVQFYWWDFSVPGYIEAACTLQELVTAGCIRQVGLTNFDAQRMQEVLDARVPIATNQVRENYSYFCA